MYGTNCVVSLSGAHWWWQGREERESVCIQRYIYILLDAVLSIPHNIFITGAKHATLPETTNPKAGVSACIFTNRKGKVLDAIVLSRKEGKKRLGEVQAWTDYGKTHFVDSQGTILSDFFSQLRTDNRPVGNLFRPVAKISTGRLEGLGQWELIFTQKEG